MQKPWYHDPWHWVALVMLGAIGLMAASLLPWGQWKSEVIAAWVQAVGSIVAIGVGALAVWWQTRQETARQAEQQHRDLVQRLQILSILLAQARLGARMIRSELCAEHDATWHLDHMRVLMERIRLVSPVDHETELLIVMAEQFAATTDRDVRGVDIRDGAPGHMINGTSILHGMLRTAEGVVNRKLEALGAHAPGASIPDEIAFDWFERQSPLAGVR